MTFMIKSSSMPQVLPQQGEVGHRIDRCIMPIVEQKSDPKILLYKSVPLEVSGARY